MIRVNLDDGNPGQDAVEILRLVMAVLALVLIPWVFSIL